MAHIYTASVSDVIPVQNIHAGSLHGNRLAMHTNGTSPSSSSSQEVYVAALNNASIHRIRVSLPSSDSGVEFRPSKNPNIPFPVHMQSVTCECVYKSEYGADQIMELKYDGQSGRLGAVDSRGRVTIFMLNKEGADGSGGDGESSTAQQEVEDEAEKKGQPDAKRRKLDSGKDDALLKPHIAIDDSHYPHTSDGIGSVRFEPGWAGLALHPNDPMRLATARFFHRDLTLFNGDRPERVLQLVQNPTQVAYIPMAESHSPLLAVTEHNQLSLWDMRIGGNGQSSCVARLSKTRGQLYSVTSSVMPAKNASTLVATAGVDRVVHVYDSKKWTNRHTWQNCLKYSVSHLHFSRNTASDNLIFAAGFDNGELNVGDYRKNSRRNWNGMQADSRWIGMGGDSNDVIAGFTANSSLYIVENAHAMFSDKKR